MDKDTAVKKLKEEGFLAFLDKGVVCASCPKGESSRNLMEKLTGAARSMGYEASLGVVPLEDRTGVDAAFRA